MVQQPVRSRASGVGKKRMVPPQQLGILTLANRRTIGTHVTGSKLTVLDPIPIIGIDATAEFGPVKT